VLITGHTHKFEAYAHQGAFFLNPGSATGSYSPTGASSVPTFVLMDVSEKSS
jgi:vacuolar protein sorting-associated protein 29